MAKHCRIKQRNELLTDEHIQKQKRGHLVAVSSAQHFSSAPNRHANSERPQVRVYAPSSRSIRQLQSVFEDLKDLRHLPENGRS